MILLPIHPISAKGEPLAAGVVLDAVSACLARAPCGFLMVPFAVKISPGTWPLASDSPCVAMTSGKRDWTLIWMENGGRGFGKCPVNSEPCSWDHVCIFYEWIPRTLPATRNLATWNPVSWNPGKIVRIKGARSPRSLHVCTT